MLLEEKNELITEETVSNELEQVQEDLTPVENVSAPELPADQESADTSQTQEEIPPAITNETTGQESTSQETSEESSDEQTSADGEPVAETPDAEVVKDEILDEILKKSSEEMEKMLATANANELVLLMERFFHTDNIPAAIPKVGMVKRAFDALRGQSADAVDNDTIARFSTALARFNKKRAEFQKLQEEERAKNVELKKAIIEKLKAIVDSGDVNKLNEVRAIQTEWREIGQIPKKDYELVFNEYKFLLDTFYKNREMHFELIEYDRKINLQEKYKVVEEIYKIIPQGENVSKKEAWEKASEELNNLQQQWRTIGFVPKENIEEVNLKYKEALDKYYEIRKQFFAAMEVEKKENATKKLALLEKLEPFAAFASDKARDWNKATEEVMALQETWKKIGRVPRQDSTTLWNRYRAACDSFFANKASFFKKFDEERAQNLQKKRELCEKAESFLGSTEWEKTAEKLKGLQAEWKQVGPVPYRQSEKLWKRFRAACDKFFESKREHYRSIRDQEEANLKLKEELIASIQGLPLDEGIDGAVQHVKQVQEQWKQIGRVPIKDKDSIWKKFRAEIDAYFDRVRANKDEVRYVKLRSSLSMMQDTKQREKRIRAMLIRLRKKKKKAETRVDQYSTNILFIARGRAGDNLRAQIQEKIDSEAKRLKELRKKEKALERLLHAPEEEFEALAKKIETEIMADDDDED